MSDLYLRSRADRNLEEGEDLLLLSAADREEELDPANLSATVDGDTVSLSWDASPLVTA